MAVEIDLLQDGRGALRVVAFLLLPEAPPGRIPGMFALLSLDGEQEVIEDGHLEKERGILVAACQSMLKCLIGRGVRQVMTVEEDSPGSQIKGASDEVQK